MSIGAAIADAMRRAPGNKRVQIITEAFRPWAGGGWRPTTVVKGLAPPVCHLLSTRTTHGRPVNEHFSP